MTNPILGRVERDAQRGYAGFRSTTSQHQRFQQPGAPAGYGQQGYGQGGLGQQVPTQPGYGEPGGVPGFGGGGGGGGRAITLDDVMMKTGALFGVLLAVGVASWFVVGAIPGLYLPIIGVSFIATIGLTLYFAFSKKPVSAPLAVVFAAVEGMLVGAASVTYHRMFDPANTAIFESIVTQAVLATLCVFGAMLALYKAGVIKVTKKFRTILLMAGAAYFVFAIINFGYAMFFSDGPFGFGGSGPLGIGISLLATGLASLYLTLDFDNIEKAINAGAPSAYDWTLAIGLVATLVWLYLELLRLLARLRSD